MRPGTVDRGEASRAEALSWVERETVLMGTVLRVRVAASDRGAGVRAIEGAFEEIRRFDRLLSTWSDESELARLNASPPGVPFQTSPELFSLLWEVREWSELTGGAFDPAIGSLVDAYDLRGSGRRPSADEIVRARSAAGMSRFVFDPGARSVVRLSDGAWIDSGGFGKGAALRAARRVLLESGIRSALLDFGGQILAIGSDEEGGVWTIGVAHPAHREEAVGWLRIRERSAATTSASERFVTPVAPAVAGGEREGRGGEVIGHVLDPRTGEPVPRWGSVTVVAENPLVADILSTALFVLGARDGIRWVEEQDGEGLGERIAVLFLEDAPGGLRATWNPAMAKLWVRAEPAAIEEKE